MGKNKDACRNSNKHTRKFDDFYEDFEFGAVRRCANLVDLAKCFKRVSIWLQKSASIQPRTGLSKCGDDSIHFANHSFVLRAYHCECRDDTKSPLPGGWLDTRSKTVGRICDENPAYHAQPAFVVLWSVKSPDVVREKLSPSLKKRSVSFFFSFSW